MNLPEIDRLLLIFVLILPGLIAMHVYRILMPAKHIDWGKVIFEALFYSAINFVLASPILIYVSINNFKTLHPLWYAFVLLFVILVLPIFLAWLWFKLANSKKLMAGLQLQYPTAWDYYFNRREECYALIHLKAGRMIGGYLGTNSYATAYPQDGDLYIEQVIRVNEKGQFLEFVERTRGLVIRREQYEYIEFFGRGT